MKQKSLWREKKIPIQGVHFLLLADSRANDEVWNLRCNGRHISRWCMHQTPAHMGRYSMDNTPPGKVIQQRRGEESTWTTKVMLLSWVRATWEATKSNQETVEVTQEKSLERAWFWGLKKNDGCQKEDRKDTPGCMTYVTPICQELYG